MNGAPSCHEFPECPGLFVDAFKGSWLRKTQNADNCFILSHYHGDHYGNLPKEGRYAGPAQIHCTPVTASLLRAVHEVPEMLVVEHSYGERWVYHPRAKNASAVHITFYDANHCPGAAIIVVEHASHLHVHTGDMRYHEKMKSYPILRNAALNRRIDLLLLDTTYGHPKHDFVSQEVAVENIATQVCDLLGTERSDSCKTLVLLSCYSIGKEKVVWESATRCNQLVLVSDQKLRMMQCVQGHDDVSSQIVHKCTLDPALSDIHVVPMGFAGEMWPFFRGNFGRCADYALEQSKRYDKVVAFIPTGWAGATNWNKKNSICRANCKGIEVEVRLICYSEHSSYPELQAFVSFLRPRKVIPTVFKDENDSRRIEARFQVDSTRAKQHFINKLVPKKRVSDEVNEIIVDKTQANGDDNNEKCLSLQAMGFSYNNAVSALKESRGSVEGAIEILLSQASDAPISLTARSESEVLSPKKLTKTTSIKAFFQVKRDGMDQSPDKSCAR